MIGSTNLYYNYSPKTQIYDCKENGININNLNNSSYSSSSGVSSGQSSPLYSLICNESERKNLHNQIPIKSVRSKFIGLQNLKEKTTLMHLFENSRIVSQHNNIEQLKLNIDNLILAGADINAQNNGCFFYI